VQVIRQARALAPQARVVTRARYHAHARALERAGAEVVVDEEQEVGRLLGAAVLAQFPLPAAPSPSAAAG
jgi:Trk K+ transport system NAD-binding subunit